MPRRSTRKQPNFDPTLSRGIISIVLVIFAAVIVLSFFDAAGPLGFILNKNILSTLFGNIRYTTPFIILIIAWFFIKDIEYDYRPTHGIGAFLYLISLAGLFHLSFETDEMIRQAILGHGGGFFGLSAWPLKEYLGSIAAAIILLGIFVVSVLLMFNTLIVHFLSAHRSMVASLGEFGKKVFGVMQKVSNAKEANYANDEGDEYEEEDELEEDEEEYEDEEARRFPGKKMLVDEEEEEGQTRKRGVKKTRDPEIKETNSETPAWAQNVIIKDLPPLTLLSSKKGKPTSGDIEANKDIIEETLLEFGIEVDMGDVRVGPTVTQYTLKPRKGIKLSRIISLSNDLALALAAHPIRIEAPIPGKALVGIEVPNERAAMVTLKELLESKEFQTRPHPMMIGLGKDVAGKVWFGDLPRMPHLLVAGATGSGKTVCVNTILLSLLFQNTAETLRLIMVDPKRVELPLYNGIPHLLTPVITNTQKTVNALKWCISEMERRFEILSASGSRNIDSYNSNNPNDKLPHIVFVIDELADLMATAAGEVEAGIIRLAQMARAVGIHLVVATQRPSVDVITGLMKANIPARIAFSVASLTDSRTILDGPGAEKLMGRGDMLFQTAELGKPVRIQGAFISEKELKDVINYLKGDEEPEYDELIVEKPGSGTMNMFGGTDDDQDALFAEARTAVVGAGKASASFLQRKLKIGYARAARILDELEAAGIIGPADGAKPREILLTESSDLNVYDDETVRDVENDVEPAGETLTAVGEDEDENGEDDEFDRGPRRTSRDKPKSDRL